MEGTVYYLGVPMCMYRRHSLLRPQVCDWVNAHGEHLLEYMYLVPHTHGEHLLEYMYLVPHTHGEHLLEYMYLVPHTHGEHLLEYMYLMPHKGLV